MSEIDLVPFDLGIFNSPIPSKPAGMTDKEWAQALNDYANNTTDVLNGLPLQGEK